MHKITSLHSKIVYIKSSKEFQMGKKINYNILQKLVLQVDQLLFKNRKNGAKNY